MSTPSDQTPPWNDIEAVLDQVRVEEEALLAVLEAMGELDDLDEAVADDDDFSLAAFPLDAFPLDDGLWGGFSLSEIWVDGLSFRST